MVRSIWDEINKPIKRTLGIRDKRRLYILAEKKCEACGKLLEEREMQSGHILAASKSGKATLKNSVGLCWSCNNLQGTKNYFSFMKDMHVWKIPERLQKRVDEKKSKVNTKVAKVKKRKNNQNYSINFITGKREKDWSL